MARRKKGTSGPAHLAGAQGLLTSPSGKSSPESAAASRQAAAALAAVKSQNNPDLHKLYLFFNFLT